MRTNTAYGNEILAPAAFERMLALERKRTDRSKRCFVLMLVSSPELLGPATPGNTREGIISAIVNNTRDTDVKGWYEAGNAFGVIFTEINPGEEFISEILQSKRKAALAPALTADQIKAVTISCYFYPQDPNHANTTTTGVTPIHVNLSREMRVNSRALLLKRVMDIVGSVLGLILCLPIFLIIAILIKLTSKGPIFYKQQRLGFRGMPFAFLKFRSMYLDSDDRIHKEYVKRFISEQTRRTPGNAKEQRVFKLTADPRVTRFGKFLRRTSLDELPQLVNVFKGELSLVGPRPPLPYEFSAYEPWHRRRLLVVKPGITGLWQVTGRSRVTFEEMVRLDLQYARSWSLWLDIKLLLQTPRAVLSGSGAH
jgi:exopolysaccharide biosynthesis polyprenyl glycosylphosphotransferase